MATKPKKPATKKATTAKKATVAKKATTAKKAVAKKATTAKKATVKKAPIIKEVVEEVSDAPVYMRGSYAVKIIALGWKLSHNRRVDVRKKNVFFTRDGITEERDIDRRNTFETPREALLAFSEFLSRHDDFDYVDIVMLEHSEYII